MASRVVEVPFEQMSPELRALIAYEQNGALDLVAPQEVIDRVRRETPVVKWEMGYGFFELDDIVAAGRNPDLLSTDASGEPFGMGARKPLIPLHLDGEVHRAYRKLLDPLLAPRKVASLEPDIRKLADELIDGFIDAGSVELFEAYAGPLPCTIFLQMFGMPMEDYDFLVRCKDAILKNPDNAPMDVQEQRGRAVGDELDERLALRLAERRASGSRHDDLIDSFMHFEIDGHTLDDAEIVNIMHMFTIAGLDTVTSSISCLIAWFAQHPEQRRRVVADPALLPTAIEELMRIESPVPSSGVRWAATDTEVNGVPIAKGQMVYLCWASGNLDPAACPRPMSTEIDRRESRHIAFAAGIHRCLGSHLARLELRVGIDQFHRRIPDYWITEGDQVAYRLAGVRAASHLPLTFARS